MMVNTEVQMNIPKRISVGIGRRTIPFYWDDFVGNPEDYKFNKIQAGHYEYMKSILAQAGLEFTLLGAESSKARTNWQGAAGTLVRFVAFVGDPQKPDFVWQKYEGGTPGGGQNRVYVAGREMKVSEFVRLDTFMAVMMCIRANDPE
jgi:hypothetical protein